MKRARFVVAGPRLRFLHWNVGERIVPLEYRLFSTLRSDHRGQVLDFALGP